MSQSRPAGGPEGAQGVPESVPAADGLERQVNQVVVALADGRRARGFVYDINPENEDFHLFATDDPSEPRSEIIRVAECKAIYFVKSLTGNPDYEENKTELPAQRRFGRPVEVIFGDGERIVGMVEFFHAERKGFYLIPPDPKSNNLRIFVVKANAQGVRLLDAATGPGGDGDWTPPEPARFPVEKRVEVVLRHLRGEDLDDLSIELRLAGPVLSHWKGKFVEAGRAALSDAALSRPLDGEHPGAARAKRDRTPVERRLEIVLKVMAREDEAVISQVFMVPLRVLADWRERFLRTGQDALRGQAAAEGAEDPDAVRLRYEALVAPPGKEDGLKSLLDQFSDALRKGPDGGNTP